MDSLLRNLERRWEADPNDLAAARQLIFAYRRLHHNGDDGPTHNGPLTREVIEEAAMECGFGYPQNIEKSKRSALIEGAFRTTKNIYWTLTYHWQEPMLDELNDFALRLGLPTNSISLEGGCEDVTQCSCGRCRRECESRVYIVIDEPAQGEKINDSEGCQETPA
jgi:hypothetical protein